VRLRFVIHEVISGFRRNATMVSAVILVTFVSLTAVGAALLLQTQIDKLRGDWSAQVEVMIYLCPQENVPQEECPAGPVTPDQQAAVEARLSAPDLAPYVTGYTIQSSDEVYAELLESESGAGGVDLSGVTPGSLPTVVHVSLAGPQDTQIVEEAVRTQAGVYRVVDQSELLSPLFNILGKAKVAALAVAAVLMVAAILLITTTIRLSAMSRQKETGIMRLVGASNLFIQLPFMLEGAVAALLGSVLAVASLWAVTKFWLAGWVQESFGALMQQVSAADVLATAPWLVLMAVALAALSSGLTLRRFTKV
jgi:cell division transport system permease protein